MSRIACLSLIAAALWGQQIPRPAQELAIHRIGAPDLKLSAYRGKVVVLAFLNTGCSHCQNFAQELKVYQEQYGPRGMQVLAVVFNKEAREQLAQFRDQYVKGYPVGYSDEETVMNWLGHPLAEGYFVPIVAFVTRRGTVESQYFGDDNLFQDPDANLRRIIEKLLKP